MSNNKNKSSKSKVKKTRRILFLGAGSLIIIVVMTFTIGRYWVEIFDKYNIQDIDLISLAEKDEEIYTLFSSNPIKLDKKDYALKLLIRIRDEAHRFAITYFHALHSKNSLSSVLDSIKGLGKQKRKLLLEKFKDLNGILNADKSQLKTVDGVGDKLAEEILRTLKEKLK